MKRYISSSKLDYFYSPAETKSIDTLWDYAKSGDAKVQNEVLHNLNVTSDMIDYIVDNSNLDEVLNNRWPAVTLRRTIASHTKSSSYALDAIAHTSDSLVRACIIDHPNVSEETLDYLTEE